MASAALAGSAEPPEAIGGGSEAAALRARSRTPSRSAACLGAGRQHHRLPTRAKKPPAASEPPPIASRPSRCLSWRSERLAVIWTLRPGEPALPNRTGRTEPFRKGLQPGWRSGLRSEVWAATGQRSGLRSEVWVATGQRRLPSASRLERNQCPAGPSAGLPRHSEAAP